MIVQDPDAPARISPALPIEDALAAIRQWCRQVQPLFILGLARSGTSMLQVAYAQHPAMFSIAKCRETHVFVRPQQPYENPVHKPTRVYLRGRPNLLALRKLKTEVEAQHGPLSEDDLVALFFWFAATCVYPGQTPLEKTPAHLRRLDMIFRIFPQARVVVCSRDPLEVTASYRKRLALEKAEGQPPEKTAWLEKDVDQMIGVFELFTRLVRQARPKYGSRMFMAPYDWLVSQPEASLRDICTWSGLTFHPSMVTGEATFRDTALPAKVHSIEKRPSSVEKLLTADEIVRIGAACAPWLAEWSRPGCLDGPTQA